MAHIFALKCQVKDLAAIRSAVGDDHDVSSVSPESVATTTPGPDLIFVGWGVGLEDWRDSDEDRRLRTSTATAMTLTKLRRVLAFKDIPILVVAQDDDYEDALSSIQFGASKVVRGPLEATDLVSLITYVLKPAGGDVRIDARLVNPFVEATVNVLMTMASIEVTRSQILLKRDYRLFGEVSAILGITGSRMEGCVGITFHKELAKEIVHRLWPDREGEVTQEDISDALGELVNVISGQATTALGAATTYSFDLSLPTIVTGFGHEISHHSGTPCLVITFEALNKPFAVQVAITSDE